MVWEGWNLPPRTGDKKHATGQRTFEMDLHDDKESDFPGVGGDVVCWVGGAQVGVGA